MVYSNDLCQLAACQGTGQTSTTGPLHPLEAACAAKYGHQFGTIKFQQESGRTIILVMMPVVVILVALLRLPMLTLIMEKGMSTSLSRHHLLKQQPAVHEIRALWAIVPIQCCSVETLSDTVGACSRGNLPTQSITCSCIGVQYPKFLCGPNSVTRKVLSPVTLLQLFISEMLRRILSNLVFVVLTASCDHSITQHTWTCGVKDCDSSTGKQ